MFRVQPLPLENTKAFNALVCNYVKGSLNRTLYEHNYDIGSFEEILKSKQFEDAKRTTLFNKLKEQYKELLEGKEAELVANRITMLSDAKTFTVTTGHQLSLLTGPLYFIYKILTAIKLSEELKIKFPSYNFVPVYWMATEDHDFEEIKPVNLFGNKVEWGKEFHIATGRISTDEMEQFTQQVLALFGNGTEENEKILSLISNSYQKGKTLADATRLLVHSLFKKYGLVVIDADDSDFKKQFTSVITDDIFNQSTSKIVSATNIEIEKQYSIQVNPREINFFYLTDDYRERIIKTESGFEVNNKGVKFTADEMKTEIVNHPERFSPNVLLRPVYQETILPNLAYVGGPAEVHYWLQLKDLFKHFKIAYPVVVLRNCFMIFEEDILKKLNRFEISTTDVFESTDKLIADYVKQHAGGEISLNDVAGRMEILFDEIANKASAVDVTLKNSVEAERQKALNALKNVEGKMLRAEKQKQEAVVNQLKKIKEKLFPSNFLQERYDNVFPYLVKYGTGFIDEIYAVCDPLPTDFKLVCISG